MYRPFTVYKNIAPSNVYTFSHTDKNLSSYLIYLISDMIKYTVDAWNANKFVISRVRYIEPF